MDSDEVVEAVKELTAVMREMHATLERIEEKLNDLKLEAELSGKTLETIDASANELKDIARIARNFLTK